jgi:hypothetical protein
VTVTILPIVVGGLAVALVSVFSLSGTVSTRLSNSDDAQIVSTYYVKDVDSALQFTIDQHSTAGECGTGTQLLGLDWNFNQQSSSYETVVSYVEPASQPTTLLRNYCTSGASTNPTSTTTVSTNMTGAPQPVVTPAALQTAALGNWISTQGVTGVTFNIAEPEGGSHYNYTLAAVPRGSSNVAQNSSLAGPTSQCGDASPNTGTYTPPNPVTLCFVNFSAWNTQTSAPGSTCVAPTIGIFEGIQGTPYTLSFCMSATTYENNPANLSLPVTGTADDENFTCGSISCGSWNGISATPLPTYDDAFLGCSPANCNGTSTFYTGIPGDPALYTSWYQSVSTIHLTNIQVLSSNGTPATGWNLATGDAESTDDTPPQESITWQAGWNNSLLVPAAQQVLTLIPNNQFVGSAYQWWVQDFGNACDGGFLSGTNSDNSASTPPDFTGAGTSTVTCQAGASATGERTGAVMLSAPEPNSLTITLGAGGLQAAFIGFLL